MSALTISLLYHDDAGLRFVTDQTLLPSLPDESVSRPSGDADDIEGDDNYEMQPLYSKGCARVTTL